MLLQIIYLPLIYKNRKNMKTLNIKTILIYTIPAFALAFAIAAVHHIMTSGVDFHRFIN